MDALRILLDAITRFVQLCATLVATLVSIVFRRPSTPREPGRGLTFLRGKKGRIVAAVCSLAIIVSVARLVKTTVGPSRKMGLRPYEAMGRVCAEETAKLLGGHGQIVLITWDTSH
jgi:hypothetical protein